uniref:Uncharacterized protein n=1 Tax=Arundo donax TaxID=35708 RepID=A0A0A9HI89_ARUDO
MRRCAMGQLHRQGALPCLKSRLEIRPHRRGWSEGAPPHARQGGHQRASSDLGAPL